MGRGRATFIRLLLAGVLAVACVTDNAQAQISSSGPPTSNFPPSRGDNQGNNGGHNNNDNGDHNGNGFRLHNNNGYMYYDDTLD